MPLPHSALSWILSEVENLTSSNLAQLVSPIVALPAELFYARFNFGWEKND